MIHIERWQVVVVLPLWLAEVIVGVGLPWRVGLHARPGKRRGSAWADLGFVSVGVVAGRP